MKLLPLAVTCLLVALSFPASPPVRAAEDHGDSHAEEHDAAHPAGDAHEGDINPLAADVDLALWTGIVFLVLLVVLGKFAWGPIIQGLNQREQYVADNIAAAEARNNEAKSLLADYEKKLASATDEVRAIIEEARRDAEHTKEQIIADAKSAASAEHERQMREIQNATDAAKKELGEKSAQLAVALAGKIVQERLDPEDHQRLIREAMTKFTSEPSSN